MMVHIKLYKNGQNKRVLITTSYKMPESIQQSASAHSNSWMSLLNISWWKSLAIMPGRRQKHGWIFWGVNWVALSHRSSVSRKQNIRALHFRFGKRKSKVIGLYIYFSPCSHGNVSQATNICPWGLQLMITDKYVIIILFSSGGQLLIA